MIGIQNIDGELKGVKLYAHDTEVITANIDGYKLIFPTRKEMIDYFKVHYSYSKRELSKPFPFIIDDIEFQKTNLKNLKK